MRSIPIDVLRAFVAVVEARGFTRAAEELGRSQPTVSLQVKRLEELIEAPLFERSARLELTPVGAVCFDYGKRLLRLHDDMLDEAQRRRSPDSVLRVGAPGAFAAPLAAGLSSLREAGGAGGFEFVAESSDRLAAAFRQSTLDLAVTEAEEEGAAQRWRAALGWFGTIGDARGKDRPLPLVLPPVEDAAHRAAIGALRNQGRKFDIVCASADYAVLTAAAVAGLGLLPMIDDLAPPGLRRCAERSLPALPRVTLSLLARSPALAEAGRRWVEQAAPKLQRL
jgi:DNA-binding transcriptional LysR family regulator